MHIYKLHIHEIIDLVIINVREVDSARLGMIDIDGRRTINLSTSSRTFEITWSFFIYTCMACAYMQIPGTSTLLNYLAKNGPKEQYILQ